jgi:hypothetical protein
VLDEITALETAISEIEPGAIVVFFYEKLEPALALLDQLGARPAQSIPSQLYSEEPFLQSATG